MRQRHRWGAVAALLTLGVLLSPDAVPLYDGVGFPDEPYRFVPARGDGPAATTASVMLRATGGVNTGGLLANSAELGPQVSVYAPPRAFGVPSTAATSIRLTATPMAVTAPAPPGELESNVYDVALTSTAGPVTVKTNAQQPGVTLRAVSVREPLPVMYYRPSGTQPWKELVTRRVGRDNFNAVAPGPGQYVLSRKDVSARKSGGSGKGLFGLVGAVVLLMAAVVVGVRLLSSRRPEE